LALAASVASMTNLFLLLVILDKRIGPLDRRDIVGTSLRILSSAALMGAAIHIYLRYYGADLETAGLFEKIAGLLVVLILGFASYFVFSYLLRLRELDRILELLKIKKG
jgi:peptidoglycan biosynthesis protein MviN/MurJ (putative lipid II flippase)